MQNITLKLIVICTSWLIGTLAFANGDILSRSYYLDSTNKMTFEQVQNEKFTSYENVLTGGFQNGTYWLKLKLRPIHEESVLRIRPLFNEEIEFFDPGTKDKKPLMGARYSWKSSEVQGGSYNFLVNTSDKDRDIFLRVKSARTYLIYVDVMTKNQYQDSNYIQHLLYTGYSTFTLMLALWLFITWLMNKEMVLGIFAIQQMLAFLHTSFHTGFIRPFLDSHISPVAANSFFSLTVVVYPFVSIMANKLLLQEYGLKKTYRYFFNVLLLVSLIVIGLFAAKMPIAFKLNNFLVLAFVLLIAIASLFGTDMNRAGFKAGALPIHILRAFYTLNAILWILTILPYLGVIPAGEIALHTVFVYSLMSGLVFFFLLQYRSKALLKMETARATALKAEADQERKQREEQGMLMAMLSHEIKTPLSVLKLVVDEKVAGSDLEGHANRAVSNIDLIVERCLQLGKLDAEAIRLNPREVDISNFLNQIAIDHKVKDRLVIDCDQTLTTYSDTDLLRVVLSNLVENAVKYSPSKTEIGLRVSESKRHEAQGIEFEVSNTIGVLGKPDPQLVFKKYYRNASATKISGSGIGLYLVKELITILGGDVEYVPGEKIISFRVWIPA